MDFKELWGKTMKMVVITLIVMVIAFSGFVAGGKYLQNQAREIMESSPIMRVL